MSTAVCDEPTLFDSPPATYLDRDSNGMEMTRAEFQAVEGCDRLYRYELIHGLVIVNPYAAESERAMNARLGAWLLKIADRWSPASDSSKRVQSRVRSANHTGATNADCEVSGHR